MIIDIALIILILSASALCIYLIISLKQLNQTLSGVQKDVHDLVDKAIPTLENINEITDKANSVSSDAKQHWDEVSDAIYSMKNKVSNFKLTDTFDRRDNPIQNLIANLTAVVKGITAFWSEITK